MRLTTFTQKLSGILAISIMCAGIHTKAAAPEPSTKIFSLTNGLSYTEIPFRLINDLIVIPVRINGGEALNFVVDTGTSSPVILHRRHVRKINLTKVRKTSFQGAGGGKLAQGTVVTNFSLRVADAFAPNLGAVVLDRNPLKLIKMKGVTIHGVIGATLFRSFAVEIDFPAQIIRLHDGEGFLDENTYSSLPLNIVSDRPIIATQVKWKGALKTLKLMVDTGFNHHLLLYNHPFIQGAHLKSEKIGMGYSGTIIGKAGNMQQLHLGERKIFDVHTYFPSSTAYKINDAISTERDGIIGNALLKSFCVVLDYAHAKLYIREDLPWPFLQQEMVYNQSVDA